MKRGGGDTGAEKGVEVQSPRFETGVVLRCCFGLPFTTHASSLAG